ncbi:unnamed protein product, partial [Mesorhabditis spiculigera]
MVRTLEELKPDVNSHIRAISDFPKPGINFRDVMPLMAQPSLMGELCAAIAEHYRKLGGVDLIAGLEARGFLFGPQVAILLNVPFVPIRKKGKLPGEDIVEVQKGVVREGQRVAIVDDLLATGGTMKAAIELMRSTGATVVEAFVLIELTPLNGRAVISDVPVNALLSYNEA